MVWLSSDALDEFKRAKQSLSVSALSPAPPCIFCNPSVVSKTRITSAKSLPISRTSIFLSCSASELVSFALQTTTSTFGQHTVIHKYPLNTPCISICIQSDLFPSKAPRIASSPPSHFQGHQPLSKPDFLSQFSVLFSWSKHFQVRLKLHTPIVHDNLTPRRLACH